MDKASVVFSLDTRRWDFADAPDEGLITPELEVYCSATEAAADREGLEIVETLDGFGDLWFFAADGSPLEAHFSQEPSINFDKHTYFPGIYSLHPGTGENLFDVIRKVIARSAELSARARIVVLMAGTNEEAKRFGWPDTAAMKKGVEHALQILPPDMRARVVFAKYIRVDGEVHCSIGDAP